jgi:hypothetical protein
VDTKNNFPELSDEWVFVPEKNVSLQNQIIFTGDNLSLLNVRKLYTNGIYFGVIYTVVNKEGEISHNFRCKDRGFTEEIVDDKEAFIYHFKQKLSQSANRYIKRSKFKSIKADFLQEYQVAFIIDDDGNYFATTALVNKAPTRGIYGAITQKQYEQRFKENGFSILNRFPTEEEVKFHLIDKQIDALSANFYTRENTAYSNVKIYHKTEI